MNYEDDIYHPNIDDEFYNENIDDHDSSHMSIQTNFYQNKSSSMTKQKQLYQAYKSLDKDYHYIKRVINGKKVSIDLYTTPHTPGIKIRHAPTGNRYTNMFVGSFSENYFFKVKDVSGVTRRDSGNLYFDSPEECEKYLCINVSDDIKKRWKEKYDAFCKENIEEPK